MPCDMTRYGPGWPAFRVQILARAQMQCECTGECGLHRDRRTARRCTERHAQPAIFAKGRIALGIAHLCHCNPPCTISDHVRAMCQRCHLRTDRFKHAAARLRTQGAPLLSKNPLH